MHDEIDVSVPKTKEGYEALRELKNIMETCVEISVPIIAEVGIGDNWNDVDEEAYDEWANTFEQAA